MTVKELIQLLQGFPPDVEVLERRYSEWQAMTGADWHLGQGVDVRERRGYIMRYPTGDWRLSKEEYRKDFESIGPVRDFVVFEGN